MGKEEDLETAPILKLYDADVETEAEGRRRGVAALLEVSFAMADGEDVALVTGSNSKSLPAMADLGAAGRSSADWLSSSSIDNTVLVSVCMVESSVKKPCLLFLLACFPHP